MANFTGQTVTNAGRNLLGRVLAGEGKLVFTKAAFGDQKHSDDLRAVRDLKHKKLDLKVMNIRNDSGTAVLTVYMSNENVEEGFRTEEFGVYAKIDTDDEEILYSYCVAIEADFFPNNRLGHTYENVTDVYMAIANDVDADIHVQDGVVFLTKRIADENYIKYGVQAVGELEGRTSLEENKRYSSKGEWYLNIGGNRSWDKSPTPDENLIPMTWDWLFKNKEPIFKKKSGFNLEKTDSYEEDNSDKLFTQKGANDLKREIDYKLPLIGGEMNGNIHNNMNSNTEGLYSFTRGGGLAPNQFVGGIKANWFSDTAIFGIMRGGSTELLNNCLKLKLNDVLYDVYHSGYNDTGFTTSDKTIKGAINELNNDKLEKAGYTGNAKNLNDEISKKASTSTLGRMMVGSYLSADGSGRVSVNVQNDPSVRDESSVASSLGLYNLYNSVISRIKKRTLISTSSTGIYDLNNLKEDGFYAGFKWNNCPDGLSTNIACIDVKTYSDDWIIQMFYAMGGKGFYSPYMRAFVNGNTWTPWTKVITESDNLLAGVIGNEIDYIQKPGVKTPDKIYIDKTTGKLYRPLTNTSDTQVTQNFRVVSILDNSNGIGFGQKYKRVEIPKGARQTNNTGRPIFYSTTEAGDGDIQIYVDDIKIAWFISTNNDSPTSFIVPAGSTWYWTGGRNTLIVHALI